MVKKIISVATAFLMLCCMVPFYAFAESATCPKCGKDTLITNQDISVEIGEEVGLPLSLKRAYCSNCHYAKYEYNVLGVAGEQAYDDGDESHIINFLKSLKEQLLGKNATATKFTPGGGSTSGGGAGRNDLPGYNDDNGTPSIASTGSLIVMATPVGLDQIGNDCFYSSPNITVRGSSGTGVISKHPLCAIYKFDTPVDGLYYLGSDLQNFNGGRVGYLSSNTGDYIYTELKRTFSKKYELSVSLGAGGLYYLLLAPIPNNGNGSVKFELNDVPILVDPYTTTINKQTNITINNNDYSQTWNGNIYTDNSTNLTYIYPQYTTVNEKNETVTNISTNPIIYNNETKQYYTYDQTTKNYYYITYNTQPTPSPSPTPAPTDKPGGSISTPETGKPGGDTGDSTGILAVLVAIKDNMIQGFANIKTALVAGFADLSANFTLAIENLTINIQNFFSKGMSGSPVDPNIPGGGTISTPETGDKDNNSGSGWSWNPLKWLSDLLKDIVEGIIKTIWKLITSLFGFLLWLLSLVGKLFPFIPGQAILAVTSAVVIVAVIRIIKFITGR